MNTRDPYRDQPEDAERQAMLDEIECHRARADRANRLLKSCLIAFFVSALVCGPYRVMMGAVYVASETYRSVVRWVIHRDQGQPVDVAAPRAAFAPILCSDHPVTAGSYGGGYMYYSVSGDGVVSPCDDLIKTGCWRISVDLGNTEWIPSGGLAGAYSATIACQNAERIPGGKYVCGERHADVIGRAGHKVQRDSAMMKRRRHPDPAPCKSILDR